MVAADAASMLLAARPLAQEDPEQQGLEADSGSDATEGSSWAPPRASWAWRRRAFPLLAAGALMAATALLACHLLAPAGQRSRAEVEQVSIKYGLTDAESSAPEAAARAAQDDGSNDTDTTPANATANATADDGSNDTDTTPAQSTTSAAADDGSDDEDTPVIVGGDGGLPPWWILYNVTPAEEKDMGSSTAVAFSPEQQQQYGVDEDGEIVNQTQFDSAIEVTAPAPADDGSNDTDTTPAQAAAPTLAALPVDPDDDSTDALPVDPDDDSTDDDSTATIATPEQAECPKSGEHCGEAKCCSEPGMQCYKKDEWWSSCNKTCDSMVSWVDGRWQSQQEKTWDCKELGERAAGGEEEGGGEDDTAVNDTAPVGANDTAPIGV